MKDLAVKIDLDQPLGLKFENALAAVLLGAIRPRAQIGLAPLTSCPKV